jgi:hypothetical protein
LLANDATDFVRSDTNHNYLFTVVSFFYKY